MGNKWARLPVRFVWETAEPFLSPKTGDQEQIATNEK